MEGWQWTHTQQSRGIETNKRRKKEQGSTHRWSWYREGNLRGKRGAQKKNGEGGGGKKTQGKKEDVRGSWSAMGRGRKKKSVGGIL